MAGGAASQYEQDILEALRGAQFSYVLNRIKQDPAVVTKIIGMLDSNNEIVKPRQKLFVPQSIRLCNQITERSCNKLELIKWMTRLT